jgi:hypothetical protein
MTLQSSGAINFQQIQNEFKGSDARIQAATGASKLIDTFYTDTNTPFPGRTPTTGTETPSSQVTLTSSTIDPKTSYGSITYSNTSNDNQPLEYSIPIDEYYRGGIYVPDKDFNDVLINESIPTSGEISLANFYGGIGGDIVEVINTNRENLDLSTLFSGADWVNTGRRKRVIINQGIVIGGTSANAENYALKIPANLKGALIIVNYGDIVGYGGPSQQSGGNAILVGAPSPVTTNNAISNITHNLTSGIYGVVPQLSGIFNNILTPIGITNSSTHIAHGSGEFSIGDSIYIYNKPLALDSSGDLIQNPSSVTDQVANLCQISGKETATFTAYISSGNLTSTGNILTVVSGTQPSVGMGIISGTSYKKHIITRINTIDANVSFNGNKLLRASLGFTNGMILSGQGLVAQTVVTASVSRFPPSTSFWGSCSGTTFTVNVATTDPILPGFLLSGTTGIPSNLFVVQQLSGTTGSVGTYQISQTATGSVTSYGYFLLNNSQTITGPVDVNGIRYILNDDTGDGITSSENELVSVPISMTAVRYLLNKNVNSTLDLRNKSTPFKFFTAGGTTLPGFTVTTTSLALSVLVEGQSVTISGSTATATGTNNPSINTSKFNGTWNNINKIAGSPSTKFFVATTKIDNTYTSSNGSFPTSTTTPFTTPIKILNYGRIYGGGGGGYDSIASRSQTLLYNYLTNTYSSNTTGTVNNPNKVAAKIQLFRNGGFNGIGGVGQGYNQAKTLGTSGLPNPNAPRSVYLAGYGNFTYTGGVDPYLDLISIPPNTQVNMVFNGRMVGDLNSGAAAWKNVYLGSGSTLFSSPYGTNSTIYTNVTGSATGSFHYLKVNNLFTFGTGNTLSFQPNISGTILRRIDNFYRNSAQTATFSTGWTVTNTITTPQTNPYPTDRVRIVTTTNQFTYDVFFPDQNLAPKAGDGGDYGQSGQSGAPAGLFITNSFIYSNVTWVNRGDLRGGES